MKRDHCGAPPVALIGEPRRVAGRPRIRPETWAKGSGELKKKLDSKKKNSRTFFHLIGKTFATVGDFPPSPLKDPFFFFIFEIFAPYFFNFIWIFPRCLCKLLWLLLSFFCSILFCFVCFFWYHLRVKHGVLITSLIRPALKLGKKNTVKFFFWFILNPFKRSWIA